MLSMILVASDRVLIGCLKETDRLHQYLILEQPSDWRRCREECNDRRMKVCAVIVIFLLCVSIFIHFRSLFIQ